MSDFFGPEVADVLRNTGALCADSMFDLRGFWLKLTQVAVQIPYIENIFVFEKARRSLSDVPPEDTETVKSVMLEELRQQKRNGVGIFAPAERGSETSPENIYLTSFIMNFDESTSSLEYVYESCDFESPLGSATIAAVYRCKLSRRAALALWGEDVVDSDQEIHVAVKVQNTEAEEVIAADMSYFEGCVGCGTKMVELVQAIYFCWSKIEYERAPETWKITLDYDELIAALPPSNADDDHINDEQAASPAFLFDIGGNKNLNLVPKKKIPVDIRTGETFPNQIWSDAEHEDIIYMTPNTNLRVISLKNNHSRASLSEQAALRDSPLDRRTMDEYRENANFGPDLYWEHTREINRDAILNVASSGNPRGVARVSGYRENLSVTITVQAADANAAVISKKFVTQLSMGDLDGGDKSGETLSIADDNTVTLEDLRSNSHWHQ